MMEGSIPHLHSTPCGICSHLLSLSSVTEIQALGMPTKARSLFLRLHVPWHKMHRSHRPLHSEAHHAPKFNRRVPERCPDSQQCERIPKGVPRHGRASIGASPATPGSSNLLDVKMRYSMVPYARRPARWQNSCLRNADPPKAGSSCKDGPMSKPELRV